MHIRTILEEIGDQIWDTKNRKWLSEKDDKEVEFGIIFGDPGGDSFIKEFENEEKFNEGLQDHFIGKNTGCDFTTEVYLVIKNGKEYKPTIS